MRNGTYNKIEICNTVKGVSSEMSQTSRFCYRGGTHFSSAHDQDRLELTRRSFFVSSDLQDARFVLLNRGFSWSGLPGRSNAGYIAHRSMSCPDLPVDFFSGSFKKATEDIQTFEKKRRALA